MGQTWRQCVVPPTADHLDFRGIQAFDNETAIVMSSGRGDLSRLYKTTDGGRTWKLLFANPDSDGSWSGLQFEPGAGRELGRVGYIAGDPVHGWFADFITYDYGDLWSPVGPGVGSLGKAKAGETIFASSNSALTLIRNAPVIVTGGAVSRLREASLHVKHDPQIFYEFVGGVIPLQHSESAGAFSFAARLGPDSLAGPDVAKFIEKPTHSGDVLVVVGGDFRKPDASESTAASSTDGGMTWSPPITPPRGYRFSVAYDKPHNAWITVGPNGTDISNDDGRNWRPLRSKPGTRDPSDADQQWNALSLPFVVGPHGRIGKFKDVALTH